MATAVDAAIEEITARFAVIDPQHEGLRDFALLDLQPRTAEEVKMAIQQYDRRVALMHAARAALQQLAADGHPDLDAREVAQAVYDDLKANAETIQAALKQFESNEAVALKMVAGEPEKK